MRQNFGPRQTLLLLLLLFFVLAPRPLAGFLDLGSAFRSIAAGDYAAASSALVSAAARLPWRSDLWGKAGQASWRAEDPEQAIRWFAEGESRQALSLADWLAYGDSLQALGDQASALRAWQQSILQHEPTAAAYWRLAKASRQAGDFVQSIEYLRKALALAPEDADVHYELGLLLVAVSPAEALPELMQAAALDPALEETVRSLRAELNRAFLVEDRAYQSTVAGRALASLGAWDLAAEAFSRALEADPEYAEAWAWLGEARQQTGRDGRAELEQALSLDPHSVGILALDGLYWLRNGQPQKALDSYRSAAALEPENAAWQIALGEASAAAGELAEAASFYLHATELAPEDPAAWRALALFSLDHDIDVENTGLVAARRLLRLAPDDWLSCDIAGRVAVIVRAQVEAEAHLLKAIELAPQEPAPHYHLALAYMEFGQTALAYDKLVDTVALDPDGPYGWQAKRLLERYFP